MEKPTYSTNKDHLEQNYRLDKIYYSIGNLKKHERIHSGNKPKMRIGSIIKTNTLKKWPKFSIFFSKKCLRMFGGFLKGKKLIKNRKSDFICLIFCISQTYKSMNLFNYKYIYLEKVAKVLKKNLKKILDKDMSQ